MPYSKIPTIYHSYHEANQLANALARHSYSLSDACFFADCPNDFKHILGADEKGYVTSRIISL
jgi:hypothetical protein